MKVDEDLPRQVADLVTERGHDAATVVEQSWQGMSDEMLWPRVQAERRWLITADKGFADLRRYPPGSHAGVILLRPQEESRRAYLAGCGRKIFCNLLPHSNLSRRERSKGKRPSFIQGAERTRVHEATILFFPHPASARRECA